MREIKFRAWDTVNKMWLKITGFETHNSDDDKAASINTGLSGMFHDGDYIGTFQKHGGEQNNVILMQYTGLKDKNGVEIYEGDIECEDNGFKSIVCYLERYGAYCFVPVELYKYEDYAEQVNYHYGTDCYFDNARPSKYSNIIGNIYENPELLLEEN